MGAGDPLGEVVRRKPYQRGLVFCGVIGIPVSLAAFWFLAGLHELEHLLWQAWPKSLGWDQPPWWWPFPLLGVGGVVVAAVVTRLPGRGGHVPAQGLQPGGASVAALPGVALAAVASLPMGAVLGPEAPMIALGGGLALLFRDLARAPATEQGNAVVGAAGSASAIAVIFGNPVVAAVLLMEVSGIGGPQLLAVMLPALLASGVGAVLFTGFGHWTGLKTDSLDLGLPAPPLLDWGDVVWGILLAAALGVLLNRVVLAGRFTARLVERRPFPVIVGCALAAAACGAVYAAATGRSPADVMLSGQAALGELGTHPHAWSVGALVAVLAFKGFAYAVCLGGLRGGPVFPALFLGGAAGVLLAPLPGFGLVPAMAAGMSAAVVSVLRLPVSSVILVALLLGHPGSLPIVVLAVVVSLVTTELL
ncbi:chloride channel protein [Actinacidiphila guanduensis]|uniref:H+/Cl-antiporter ClcA n=1 Tax=Actinacidiphila guanduensis TaxID=310781 RepID=A0A1H0FPF2_9ACTN|nr:chloride channel protein [Actinacidiphila guanduensis]SDN96474.1 H+/Cl-antiporter ClcA [Actinacidiphila guanduensis]